MDFSPIFELAETGEAVPSISQGRSIGIKTGDELERVDKVLLEQQYARDGLVFNMINKYITGIMSSKANFVGADEEETRILRKYQRRMKLNAVLLPKTGQDLGIFGVHYSEKIPDINTGRLLDLDVRDAKYMDISRARLGGRAYPLMDPYGNPQYYVQYLNYGQEAKDESRVITQLGKKAIKFKIEEMLKINLFTLGDSQDGIGLIEPMYNSIRNKQEVEKAVTQAILRLGNPIVYGSVGNDRVYPTKNLIDNVSNELMDINERTGFTIPNYVELKVLEAKSPEKLTDNLEYYIDQMVAGGGLPKSLATGTGEGSNKHTLSDLITFLSGAFIMIKNNIAEAYETQVLPDIRKYENLQEAKFVWEEAKDDSQDPN